MQSVYTILLLIVSNIFMTCAWYGHLKMKQQFSWFEHLPLFGVILFSWFLAFFEYCFQVPANRIGFRDNGGPFNLIQLKVIQEVITLVVFVAFSTIALWGSRLMEPCACFRILGSGGLSGFQEIKSLRLALIISGKP